MIPNKTTIITMMNNVMQVNNLIVEFDIYVCLSVSKQGCQVLRNYRIIEGFSFDLLFCFVLFVLTILAKYHAFASRKLDSILHKIISRTTYI